MQQVITSLTTSLMSSGAFLAGGLVYQSTDAAGSLRQARLPSSTSTRGAVRFLQSGVFAVEPTQGGRGVGDNGGERLVYPWAIDAASSPRGSRRVTCASFSLRLMQFLAARLCSVTSVHRSDKFDATRCIGHSMRRRMDIFGRVVGHQPIDIRDRNPCPRWTPGRWSVGRPLDRRDECV